MVFADIRMQQRNGRKNMTIVEGISTDFDPSKLLRSIKKKLYCQGTVVDDGKGGNVLQFTGDQRNEIAVFLVRNAVVAPSELVVHGA